MNKQESCKEILHTTLFASGIGFFAGINLLYASQSNDLIAPFILLGYGAAAGFGIGLGVTFINEMLNSFQKLATTKLPGAFEQEEQEYLGRP